MRWGLAVLGAIGLVLAASVVPAQQSPDDARVRLAQAKQASAAALARSQALERAAASEKNEAVQARAQEAAVAARVQQAEADIAAAQARIAIVARLLGDQKAKLAVQQGPIVRLVAALQSLARRPALIAVVQPGSVDDLVHVRAVLGTAIPAVQARTAGIRSELQRTRSLQASAALAASSLTESRGRLEAQRLALTRLEVAHRLKSRQLGRDAMFESDRAIGLGERARDLVDLMQTLGDAASTRASLESLPGPIPRPPRPGEVATPIDTGPTYAGRPPYRLPADGRVVTGLGELSDAGVRSRGLTLAVAAGVQVVAPAAGRVVFAGPFRDYGRIAILDHGGGWTSLVSGMGSVSVRVGDTVSQGSPIGQSPSGDDPRITIELRRKGRAIDMTPLIG